MMVEDKKMEKLPEGWKRVMLREVGDINMGQSPPSTEINEKEIGIPFLQGNAEFTNKYPIPQKWIKKPLKISKKGDILISVRAPVGAINKADRAYCIGRGLAAISFKTIDEKFGWFGLVYWKYQLENLSQGSTFEAISKTDLKNLSLLIPTSFPEQRKIAEILETVDNSIEKTDKIIEKYKRIKQGLMQVLLTRGIVESDELGVMSYESKSGESDELGVRSYESKNKSDELGIKSYEFEGKRWEIRDEKKHKFKDSPLGRIPEEWEIGYLSNFAEVNPKVELSPTNIYPYIEMDATPIMGKQYKYLTYRRGQEAGSKFKGGDILLARITPCAENGKALLVSNKISVGIGSTEFITFRAKERVDNVFLFYLLISDFVRNIAIGLMEGTSGRQRIPTYVFKEVIRVAVPKSLEEQQRIASILSQIDEVIEKEQKYKAKLERIKQGLMEDLLTGKVRVEVD